MPASSHVLLTGASGLVGKATLARLLALDPQLSVTALVREGSRARFERDPDHDGARVQTLVGDIERPGLGLSADERGALERRVTHVVHAAANTRFSQTLSDARRVNATGTAHVVDLMSGCAIERFVYVSTAFVAGALEGLIPEREHTSVPGWINPYERSKHEAEAVVRASGLPMVIARSSTIVCDDLSGRVSQFNAVHQALHLFHSGLAAMLPGSEECPVDLVTTNYVADALARLALGTIDVDEPDETFHLCAGSGAIPLGELLDRSRAVWRESDRWRARGIERPSITGLDTYRLFERSVRETGDARVRAITRGLSTFVPQLSFPKRFLTDRADRVLGASAPAVTDYWDDLCRHLTTTRWAATTRRVG